MTRRNGITLIECLASIVAAGVLLAAVYAVLLSGARLAQWDPRVFNALAVGAQAATIPPPLAGMLALHD